MVAILEVTEMGESLTNWLTTLIALASLLAFLRLTQKQIEIQKQQADIAQKQGEISHQQLALLQRQEEERQNEFKKANLSYELLRSDPEGHAYQLLIIRNAGPSEAREIEVLLNGRPLAKSMVPIRPQEKIAKLPPNSQFKYDLYAGVGCPLPNQIVLHWSDDFENDRSLEGAL